MSDNKYFIHVLHVDTYGVFFAGFGGGFGNISSGKNLITVCKEKNLSDYTIVTSWINMKTNKFNTKNTILTFS